MAVEPSRHLFTADEYQRMGRVGLFDPDARLELLDGEIVEMTPIGAAHADVVNRINALLVRRLGDRAVVAVGNPVRVNDLSEPQPDVAILRPLLGVYPTRLPGPDDVWWLVEVSDSTARWDRRVKTPLYARSGIRELWIVDIEASLVEVSTGPGPGGYETVETLRASEAVAPLAFPDLAIAVSEILGL